MNTFLLHLQPFRIHKAFVAPLWGFAGKSHAETPLQCDQYEGASNVRESSTPQESLRSLCQALTLDHIAHHHHLHPSSSECYNNNNNTNTNTNTTNTTNNNNNNNNTTTTTTTNNNNKHPQFIYSHRKISDKHHLSFGTVIGSSRVASSKGKTWAPLKGAKWISPFKCLGWKIWKRWRFGCTVMQNEP